MVRRKLMDSVPASVPALGPSRSRVLAMLQESKRPLGVVDIAEQIRLHPNTARFHLDGLVDAGLADRTTEGRSQPGRPRTLYAANAESSPAGRRSYQFLAEILTSYVAAQTPRPAEAAQKAGEAWGRALAAGPASAQGTDAGSATEQLLDALNDIGFDPEPVSSGDEQQILLHHCPFREAAEEHREVVCSIHLGLMQGLLAELDAPVETHRLEPFVQPSLCVAHLAARDPVIGHHLTLQS